MPWTQIKGEVLTVARTAKQATMEHMLVPLPLLFTSPGSRLTGIATVVVQRFVLG